MTPERWSAIRAVFDDVVELEPEQQRLRLAEVATSDSELSAAVESLLAADASADDRLTRFTFELVADGRGPRASDGSAEDQLGVAGRTLSHFAIAEPVASGGMGVVYRARDTRLNREVALKFPWPWYLRDASARQRFLREGRAAGALDHPNLCSIHEVGETDEGLIFLAMPLYAGETLKARIERDGAVPLQEAIAIFRQMVRGVGAAHASGIVHRDLKPANLMVLPDGTVKILDFGLAKFMEPSVTGSGTRQGTVAYMAPEQVKGLAVDARTDLWALGVILYEMLVGRRPFDGEQDVAVAHAILHDEPTVPSRIRGDIPAAVEDLVLHLLRKDPRRRISSTAELELALAAVGTDGAQTLVRRALRLVRRAGSRTRYTAVRAGVAGALILTAGVVLSTRSRDAVATPEPLTSNPQAREFYDQGRVYERRAESPGNLNNAVSLYQRALELDSNFAHARARLALTHAAIYTAGYDRTPDRRELIRSEAEAALRLRPDLATAHLALGHYWDVGYRDNRQALAAFERATRGLPESAELHASLARLYRAQGRWEDAVEAHRRAVQLNQLLFGAAMDLSFTYSYLRRYDEGIAVLDRVIALEPENHKAKLSKGYQVMRRDGTPDTLAAMLRRIPAEWDDWGAGVFARTMAARAQRRPEEALAVLNATRPDWSFGNGFFTRRRLDLRAQVYEQMGDTVRARADYRAAHDLLKDTVATQTPDAWRHIMLGLTYAGLKQRDDAVREARIGLELLPVSKDATGAPFVMVTAAEILARVGDADGALDLLDQLLGMNAGVVASVPLLRLDPTWDPLRNDPRFEQLLRRHSRNAR
jgi:tetratricopeptide (TPR) repeat protein